MAVSSTKVFSSASMEVYDVISTANGDTTATLTHARGREPDYVSLVTRETTAELWVLTSKSKTTVVCSRAGVAGGSANVQLTATLHWAERHGS